MQRLRYVCPMLIMLVIGTGVLTPRNSAADPLKDVVFLLDNSGSMIKTDPSFLARGAVEQFVQEASDQTHIAIMTFDQDIDVLAPLTMLSVDTRESVLGELNRVDYQGLLTNTPAGVERAIYELKTNGREAAAKSIVLLTDGIVDTGNVNRDLEGARWLREELAADAARHNIRIFAVALGEETDIQVIQTLTQRTNGDYFRAPQADELPDVFKRIHDSLRQIKDTTQSAPAIPSPVASLESTPLDGEMPPEPLPDRQIRSEQLPESEEPVAPPPATEDVVLNDIAPILAEPEVDRSQPTTGGGITSDIEYWLFAISVGLGLVILLVLWTFARNRKSKSSIPPEIAQFSPDPGEIPETYLYDINRVSGRDRYKLGPMLTLIGRLEPNDKENINCIIIDKATIGRRHAIIEYKHHSFWLLDQKSINGTFVNGHRVLEQVALKHGDRIRFHDVEFEYVLEGMEDAADTMMLDPLYSAGAIDDDEPTNAHAHMGESEIPDKISMPVNPFMSSDAQSAPLNETVSDSGAESDTDMNVEDLLESLAEKVRLGTGAGSEISEDPSGDPVADNQDDAKIDERDFGSITNPFTIDLGEKGDAEGQENENEDEMDDTPPSMSDAASKSLDMGEANNSKNDDAEEEVFPPKSGNAP